MTIRDLQAEVDKWIKKYGVRYFDILTNTCLLSEEVGEVSKLIARKYGEQSFKDDVEEGEIKEKIADEMSDVIWVLTCMANQLDIDLEEALKRNFDKKTNRDKTRHLNNKKLTE